MASDNTLMLRALLLDVAATPLHVMLGYLSERLRHAPLYDVPISYDELAIQNDAQPDRFREHTVRWMEEHFVLPGNGAVLLGVPGHLYAVMDVRPSTRGIAATRYFAYLQAQDGKGDVSTGPFNAEELKVVMGCSGIDGPPANDPRGEFRGTIPLVMSIDLKGASIVLDPDNPQQSRSPMAARAWATSVHHGQNALLTLGHLQKSATLEGYKVIPPPLRDAH